MIAELGSRVDDVIQFEPLNDVTMAAIVAQQLQQAVEQARMQGVRLEVDPQAAAWLARAGCSETQGARPLVQLIRRHLLVPLAAAVMDAVAGGTSTQQQRQGDSQQRQRERAGLVEGAGGVWAVATLSVSRAGVPQLQLQKL
jgi:ATP-dependent Clp protease ATP-binding subunit ClpA